MNPTEPNAMPPADGQDSLPQTGGAEPNSEARPWANQPGELPNNPEDEPSQQATLADAVNAGGLVDAAGTWGGAALDGASAVADAGSVLEGVSGVAEGAGSALDVAGSALEGCGGCSLAVLVTLFAAAGTAMALFR